MGGIGQFASSGRGGAGNMVDSTKSPKLQPQDLQTPTLKTPMVTTGRGGSGNMAKNVDPIETRARQDVQPVARRESQGAQHSGRGGAGNVFKGDDAEQAKQAVEDGHAVVDGKEKEEPKGLAAKGKAFLGLGGKKDESK
ncbi:hypothetical protein N0V93_003807 [Gnomoniopsis smithogilvyi]|uniref:Uncharacterized protein n=1 Tax=Gnomoniopsis smithogilvyi TaxID=1191159 RepID=A0A9W9D0D8_9PEZI|nr:hypothetical protein N0V93_003807 [Gnomoniopsis smithogilvyi]